MKKILLAVVLAVSAPAFAHGHGGYGSPWIPFGAGVIIGNVLSQPRPVYVYPAPQPVYVYPQQPQPPVIYGAPTTAPVIPAPGQVCELRSENINGQIVTGNFCYNR